MGYVMKTNIASSKNYGGARSTSSIKYIVIHYTGNDGDHDESNATYFKNNIVKASAHYFVDSDSVTQSVPDNSVAWSVGGSKYPNCSLTGGGTHYGKCTNSNSLSVELCDDIRNGVVYPSAKTIENALSLVKKLMKKYDIPASRVIRHFDVVGKSCPAYWCGTSAKNQKWKDAFHSKLGSTSSSSSSSSSSFSTSSTSTTYYKKYTGTSGQVDVVFEAIGVPSSYRGNYSKRKPIATKNGISGYTGTAAQNTKMISLAKQGKLKKV